MNNRKQKHTLSKLNTKKPLLWPLSNLELQNIQQWPFLELFFYESENHKKWHFESKSEKKLCLSSISLFVYQVHDHKIQIRSRSTPSIWIYICAKFLNKSTKWHFYWIHRVRVCLTHFAPVIHVSNYCQVQLILKKARLMISCKRLLINENGFWRYITLIRCFVGPHNLVVLSLD